MKTKRPTPTVYQRIMAAAQEGRGVRLSARDAWALSRDDAIATMAGNDDEAQANGLPYHGADEPLDLRR